MHRWWPGDRNGCGSTIIMKKSRFLIKKPTFLDGSGLGIKQLPNGFLVIVDKALLPQYVLVRKLALGHCNTTDKTDERQDKCFSLLLAEDIILDRQISCRCGVHLNGDWKLS